MNVMHTEIPTKSAASPALQNQVWRGEERNYLRRKKNLYRIFILQTPVSVFWLKFISETHQKCNKFVIESKRNHPKPVHNDLQQAKKLTLFDGTPDYAVRI